MKPVIDATKFGSITADGETFDHDIVIRLSGKVKNRMEEVVEAAVRQLTANGKYRIVEVADGRVLAKGAQNRGSVIDPLGVVSARLGG